MIILGGGPIGSEMAQAFARLGTRVCVVDLAPQVLSREDPDMAAEVMKAMTAEGVEIYLESAIESVKDQGSLKEVSLRDKSGSTIHLKAEQIW